MKAWLADPKECIEVFYVPAYCPQLITDEWLNAALKHNIGSKVAPRSKAELEAIITAHMWTTEIAKENACAIRTYPTRHAESLLAQDHEINRCRPLHNATTGSISVCEMILSYCEVAHSPLVSSVA